MTRAANSKGWNDALHYLRELGVAMFGYGLRAPMPPASQQSPASPLPRAARIIRPAPRFLGVGKGTTADIARSWEAAAVAVGIAKKPPSANPDLADPGAPKRIGNTAPRFAGLGKGDPAARGAAWDAAATAAGIVRR